jgi:Zn-finger nucleic acid-binding protein
MLQIIRQRSRVEKAEDFDPLLPKSQKAENRIAIDDLYSLLEQRKLLSGKASSQDVQQLTSKYPLNQQTVQTLFKYVNNITPFDVGSEDERQRGVWVENREELKSYIQQSQTITKKREESRKAEKADKPNSTQPDSERRRKEKELEDLFTD